MGIEIIGGGGLNLGPRRGGLRFLSGGGLSLPYLPGLAMWLDPAYGAYAQNNFVGNAPVEGGAFGSWKNRVAHDGYSVRNVVDATVPTYTFNDPTIGYPAMVDDGTNYLYTVGAGVPDQMTLFIVYAGRTGTNGSLFGNSDTSYTPLTRNATMFWSIQSGKNASFSGGATLNASNLFTATWDYIGGTSIVRLDGVQRGSIVGAMTKPTGTMQIGMGFSEFLTGNIAQVLMFPRILLTADIETLEAWLTARCIWTPQQMQLESGSGNWLFEDNSVVSFPKD